VAFYIDMKSRFVYAKPLQDKAENYQAMLEVLQDAKARSGRPMRFFKSDGDGIFTGKEALSIFCIHSRGGSFALGSFFFSCSRVVGVRLNPCTSGCTLIDSSFSSFSSKSYFSHSNTSLKASVFGEKHKGRDISS